MISGAAQADVPLLMIPADGNFTTAIQKGDHKAGEIQGQTRQHARLLNLLGVKQLIIGVNKMDCDTASYKEERYNEIRDEMRDMLIKVGWKKEFVTKQVPVLPISGWKGDNLLKKARTCPGGKELILKLSVARKSMLILSWMLLINMWKSLLVLLMSLCVFLFLEFTKSKELVMY